MNAEDIFRSSIGCEIMLMIKARIRLIFSRYTNIRNLRDEQIDSDKRTVYRLSYDINTPNTYSVGAKSQILSFVAPPRKKKLVTIFSQGHVWGPQKPMFY